jgi:hypothetical protein
MDAGVDLLDRRAPFTAIGELGTPRKAFFTAEHSRGLATLTPKAAAPLNDFSGWCRTVS